MTFLPSRKDPSSTRQARFAELWQSNVTTKTIQHELGLGSTTLTNWRRALNLPPRRGPHKPKTIQKYVQLTLSPADHDAAVRRAQALNLQFAAYLRSLIQADIAVASDEED